MWAAIAGDVLIVLGVVAISSMLASLNPPVVSGWLEIASTSFVASIALEWFAQYLRLWEYSTWMPTIDLLGFSVGLAPIAQITLLPLLSVFLALRCPRMQRLLVKQ